MFSAYRLANRILHKYVLIKVSLVFFRLTDTSFEMQKGQFSDKVIVYNEARIIHYMITLGFLH